jgi:UMF1 family MFS transporter
LSAPAASSLNPGVEKREVVAWAMYDFANSGYTTVVLTAVFNAYFVSVVAGNAPWATFAWTLALSISYALVMFAGPLVGAWADAHAAKKRALAWSTLVCIAGTVALAWSGPGAVAWAVAFIVVSNFAYSKGENLCAEFLPEISRPEALCKVSGWGWSLG